MEGRYRGILGRGKREKGLGGRYWGEGSFVAAEEEEVEGDGEGRETGYGRAAGL